MSGEVLVTVLGVAALAGIVPAGALVLYKKPSSWPVVVTLFAGLIVGMVSLKPGSMIMPIVMLLSFGFFIGYVRHQYQRLYALLLALSVPAGRVIGQFLQAEPILWFPEFVAIGFAFVPAGLGVFLGTALYKHDADTTSIAAPKS